MAKQKTSSNKYHHKKKKRDIVSAKRLFETGERKVLQKNIVLSNTNAPVLPLPEMMLDICGKEETEGTVFQIPDSVLDSLKALGAFKTGQHWPYFQRPSTLVRKESVQIGKLILWIDAGEVAKGEERCARIILDGTRGSGKSIVLAQAMNWAIQSNWVVIAIPNGMPYVPIIAQFNFKFLRVWYCYIAQDLVIGHTEYEFDPTWSLWVQREYTAALLGRVLKANSAVLGRVRISRTLPQARSKYIE